MQHGGHGIKQLFQRFGCWLSAWWGRLSIVRRINFFHQETMPAAVLYFPFTKGFCNSFLIEGKKPETNQNTVYVQKHSAKHHNCDGSGQCAHKWMCFLKINEKNLIIGIFTIVNKKETLLRQERCTATNRSSGLPDHYMDHWSKMHLHEKNVLPYDI